jgi:hypothetical protein
MYGRWILTDLAFQQPGSDPSIKVLRDMRQQNVGLSYNYTLSPRILLSVDANYLRVVNAFTSPQVGPAVGNLAEQAGIQGLGTAGREQFVGLPHVVWTGYGVLFRAPANTPGVFAMEGHGGHARLNLIRGKHSISTGVDYDDRSTRGQTCSSFCRGRWNFNGQYTGDGFADYLLGLTSMTYRNFPLQTYGMSHEPYSALYVQDAWKIHPNLTLNLGLRFDYFGERGLIRGQGAVWVPKIGKLAVGEDKNGKVDLTAQPGAAFVAQATKDLWVPASEAGVPPGLNKAHGFPGPRLGAAWRPFGKSNLVVRAGYGIFPTIGFPGNTTAASGASVPFWASESLSFSKASLQRWETSWPASLTAVVAPTSLAVAWDAPVNYHHEWNISVQKTVFLNSALTLSYVGNRGYNLLNYSWYNEVPAGNYANIQAVRPYPNMSTIVAYDGVGRRWYNAGQLKWERRFEKGFSYLVSYSFSKDINDNGGGDAEMVPFAPTGYMRGRTPWNRTHILAINGIYELPFGRGRTFANELPRVLNAVLGGWQLSGIYSFTSGIPLSISVPGSTLGNGWGTRANLVGDPQVSNPSAALWFNPAAFGAPPMYQFGNSGLGVINGPSFHGLDTSLMKKFKFSESKHLEVRWDMFNALNHVNLGNPDTTINTGTTGQIFSAGDARSMQFGMKFVF